MMLFSRGEKIELAYEVNCFQVSGVSGGGLVLRTALTHGNRNKQNKNNGLYVYKSNLFWSTESPGWYNWQLEGGDGPSGLKYLFLFVLFQGPGSIQFLLLQQALLGLPVDLLLLILTSLFL